MLNIMPLERRTWIRVEEGPGVELGNDANSTHVTGLNMTENQQDREDSGRTLSQSVGKVIAWRAREGSKQRAHGLKGNRE